MKRLSHIAFILALFLALSFSAHAESYQSIIVNIVSAKVVKVNEKTVAMIDLTKAIRELRRGDEKLEAVIVILIGLNPTVLKDVMARCRQGGVASFTVAQKS